MDKAKKKLSLRDLELSHSRTRITKTLMGGEQDLMPAVHVYESKNGHIKAHAVRSPDIELIRRLTYLKGHHLMALVISLSRLAEKHDAYFHQTGLILCLPLGEPEEREYVFQAKMKQSKHPGAELQSIITLTPV